VTLGLNPGRVIFVYPVLQILVGIWNLANGVRYGLTFQKLDLHAGNSLNLPARLVAKVAVLVKKLVFIVLRLVFMNVGRMDSSVFIIPSKFANFYVMTS
jgi:hypothetical protein